MSLQAGWWSAEAEWRTDSDVYGAIGIPWVILPANVLSGERWALPLGARVGFDVSPSPRWSARVGAHVATTLTVPKSTCECADDDPRWITFWFFEAGIRYQAPSGVVAGLYLPLLGFRAPRDAFPPPVAFLFAEAYIGYSWGR